jgi:hypothetical protein
VAWFNRLANLRRAARVSNEIEEELRYHIDARTADNIAAGMSREDARRDAVRRFGSVALSRERSYETEIFLWLDKHRDLQCCPRCSAQPSSLPGSGPHCDPVGHR